MPAYLPRIPESEVTLDDGSEVTDAQGINPGHLLALIDPLGQLPGLHVNCSHNSMVPWITAFKENMLEVL